MQNTEYKILNTKYKTMTKEIKENKIEKEKKVEEKENKTEDKKAKEKIEEGALDVPKKFEKLVQEIEKMSVVDLAELVKILEKKFGVSAQATTAVVAASTASVSAESSAEEPKEEKSVFNIELTAVGDKKIEVIKIVRDATQKGLKEAKDVVDAAATSPQMIKENVKKEEAEELKKQFEAAGAKVELK